MTDAVTDHFPDIGRMVDLDQLMTDAPNLPTDAVRGTTDHVVAVNNMVSVQSWAAP